MPQSSVSDRTPWWKEPYVWLIIGGPMAVIVAGIATAYIAVSNPDPVIDKATVQREAVRRAQSDGLVNADELVKLQPAQQGRNHAAAPIVPRVDTEK